MENQTEKPGGDNRHSVIVSVDMASHQLPSIELAVALAAARQSSLHGLFVEDADLMNVARLPFSQEVTLLGGRPRALEQARLQNSLDKIARHFRELLANHAEKFSLACSYSTVVGRRQTMDFETTADTEFLIVGQPQPARIHKRHAFRQVLLLATDNPLSLQALAVVLNRILDQRTELVVATEVNSPHQAVNHELTELLKKYPNVTQVSVGPALFDKVLSTRIPRSDYVITSRALEPDQFRQIMSLATCPVIVIS